MNILIIEDEQPASERIISFIREYDPAANILSTVRSVKESIEWLRSHPAPDLIIIDIQLNDGLSLEIFRHIPVHSPLIFTTAYDEYLMKAFEFNSIDYLLKPIQKEKFFLALTKYRTLKQHFTGTLVSLLEQLQHTSPRLFERIVVKKGTDFVSLKMDEISYFYTEHKVVFLIDSSGKRYIVDQTLTELETTLDKNLFFRLNRKFLTHINAVVKFKPHDKGKLLIELRPPVNEEIIVSQENAPELKHWLGK